MSNETVIASLKEKIDDLNQQAWEARVNDSPKAFELSSESVKLSREINYPKGLAEGLRSLGFCYVRLFKNDEAEPLLRESLSLFQSLNDLSGQAVIYEYLGIIERNWGNLGHSLELLLKGNELVRQVGPPDVEVTCCYQIGVTYKHLGNHENALDYLYRSLSLAEKIDLTLMVAYSTNIIGSIYFDNGNYEKALELYQQGLIIRRQSKDKWGEAGSLDNIGITYLKLNQLDKAIDYCKQSLAISQSTGDKKGEANALLHLAEMYEQANDIQQASKFSNESLTIRKARGDKRGEAEVLLFLAGLHKNGDDNEKQEIYEQLSGALKIADEIKAQDLLSKAFYDLHEFYIQKGDFKKSLAHLESHLHIEKELHKNTINQKVANLEISHKAEAISQQNKELTELNKQIEEANAELRIESSLERVRTAAMAMKEPSDMLEICKIISHELATLNIKDIRNVQTAIFYEKKGTYMNYEYYAKHDKTFITDVDYNNHTVAKEFAQKMLKGSNEIFAHGFKGDEIRDWLKYQRTTNVFIDTYLETASSLNYYWFSLGHVALGISTYFPLTEEQIGLFKRFRNVFGLAYRRYLDIEKAQAQAREAKIEAAMERVRSRSMAMQRSEELKDIIQVVYEQFVQLNIHVEHAGFIIDYKTNNDMHIWLADPHSVPFQVTISYFDCAHWNSFIEAKEKGKDFFANHLSFEEKNKFYQDLFKLFPVPAEAKEYYLNCPGLAISTVLLDNVGLYIENFSGIPFTDEENTTLMRFGKVFQQTYTRFLDLQKAEAQAREAHIEAAMERTRTQSMIMQHSNELDDTLRVFHEQVLLLGINSAFSFLWLPDEDKGRHIFWATWAEKENGSTIFKSKAINYPLNRNEPATAQCLIDWKGNEPVVSYHVPPTGVESYFAVWSELIAGVERLKPRYFSNGLYYVEAFMKYGCFGVMVEKELSIEEKKILLRFAIEFERTYTRFLDLKKSEAQTRESQIQLALERVRARTAAMQKSDELSDVAELLFKQVNDLGIKTWTTGFNVWSDDNNFYTDYITNPQGGFMTPYTIDASSMPVGIKLSEAKKRGEEFYVNYEEGEALAATYRKLYEFGEKQFSEILQSGIQFPTHQYEYFVFGVKVSLMFITYEAVPEATYDVFKRFGKVFEQTYTRFLDLQKAEAQAREAQIELGLERVRARAMAMQKSDELAELVDTVFKELTKLHFTLDRCIIIIIDEKSRSANYWMANPESKTPTSYHLQMEGIPYLDFTFKSWKERKAKIVYDLKGEEKVASVKYIFSKTELKHLPDLVKEGMKNTDRIFLNSSFNNFGSLQADTIEPISEDNLDIIYRFAKVFDLTYTRFNDLQKAEAQAREAQIELGLERLRARAMAMQRSNELAELVDTVFKELTKLDFALKWCIINIIDESTMSNTVWAANPDMSNAPESYHMLFEDYPFHQAMFRGWKERQTKCVYTLEGDEKKIYDDYLFSETEFRRTPKEAQAASRAMEKYVVSFSFSNFGGLQTVGDAPLSDANLDILSRFGKVFDLTYTRFNDLKKAEAQAREAQIEAALERVRAKVMAMTNSKDLDETSLVFGDQLRKLNIDWQFSYFWLIEEEKNENTFWITWPDNKTSITIYTLEEAEQYFNECLVSWRAGIKIHDNYVPPSDTQAWLDTFQRIADDAGGVAKQIMTTQTFNNGVYYYDAMMKYGSFGVCINKPANDEEKNIQCRFAIEFERAYTRFLDLKKAEAQTREATIEVALERVRARALAMQQPEELKEVAQVLRSEMGALGIEELETCSIYIHEKDSEIAECWYALKDPQNEEKKMVADHFQLILNDTWVGREMKRFYNSDEKQISIVMQGINRKEWIDYCYKNSPVFSGFYGEIIPDRTYHLYKFSHGYIGAAAPGEISNESWKLLSRAASVFSLAYSRFRDLTQARNDLIKLKEEKKRAEDALTELQATQKQLIQTEKMASLGELTAGIAHEIQNPLNFVNNFSDVSNELIEEMKEELGSGNTEQAMQIANDVKDNLEKILHHGKRADAIVKGMLQHSRSSSGVKEPTDINNLADEYLRLAFHGYRAKDKSFNAKFETHFDNSIEKINVIPQDIGRVILNLINNAFYTVNEKRKHVANGYEPTVIVTTKKVNDKVEISVKDNGNGIPQKMLDKIFQPFFTTKPTGQGTGLGLSLSYDIVTKGHAGEIEVKTDEGKGAEFIISLPVN